MNLAFLILTLLQISWSRQETRGVAAEAAIAQFQARYWEAQKVIAPGAQVVLEFPESGLSVGGESAIAITTWRDGQFLVLVDWRLLMRSDPLVRPFIPVHEACHLRHVHYIRRDFPLTQGERMNLEMDATYCSMVYVAQQAEKQRTPPPTAGDP